MNSPEFAYPIDTRFSETDAMGLIHHSVYFVWFEAARFKFAQEILGLTPDVLEQAGVQVPVYACSCRFIEPVRFPDRVLVGVKVTLARAARFTVQHEARLDCPNRGPVVAVGQTEHVFVRIEGGLVPRYPPLVADRLVAAVSRHPDLFLDSDQFLSVYGDPR